MHASRRTLAMLLLLAPGLATAAEPLHVQIDKLIAAGQAGHEKSVAPTASDAEFIRRVYLDLAGTLPAPDEVRTFLTDTDKAKREKLIDKLLASPGYARRMTHHFDVVLMERRGDKKVPRAAWEEYLRASFAENKPYDAFARELLAADGTDPKTRPAAKFYLDRDFEPNLVTRDVARVFLGRNLQCAQCHDHPLIDGYKQSEFFGIFAFLNRSYLFPNGNDAKAVLAEKAEGEVNFVSVFDKAKKQNTTLPRVMEGKAVDEPKMEKGKEYKVAPAANVRPIPLFSRREKLAAAMTSAENPFFARAGANRLWALLLGRGIVNPVDLDHSANPPSHPEILDLLAKEFASHKFDVKWLLREIALSKAYQRSSEIPAGAGEPPADRYFVAILKPLSAEQLAFACAQSTGPIAKDAAMTIAPPNAASAVPAFRGMFGGQAGLPDTGATTNLDQTLFLKFGGTVRTLVAPRTGSLADRLMKQTDPNASAEELFLSVYSRLPAADEKKDVAEALQASPDRNTAIQELIWALLASSEFRFNH